MKQAVPSESKQQKRLTKIEKSWVMYDWANSVYATNMMAAIFPIYYASVAGDLGNQWWGIGVAVSSLVVAILAPILGSIGDSRGMKKKFLTFFLLLGVITTAFTAFFDNWQWMLIGYVLSHIGFSGANIFYDSFLTDITTEDRMDKVSSWGFAMGYLGGSTIPFLISIGVLLANDYSSAAIKFSILITSVWWLVFSLPILRNVKQIHYIETAPMVLARNSLINLWRTLKKIVNHKALLVFILAYFFYIDGVNTVISLATNYGATLGLGSTGMIIALLVTQLVAIPFSILFSTFAKRFGSIRMIAIAIGVYTVICGVGFFMGHHVEPYQMEYASLVDSVTDDISMANQHDQKLWDEIVQGIREDGRDALSADDRVSAFYTEKDGQPAGVLGSVIAKLDTADGSSYSFTDETDRNAALQTLAQLKDKVLAYAQDAVKQADYADALGFSSLLFWLMAVLVGTVQGGIQALSRSYFGKLIPAQNSNEFFGFFDIFGKFAAVIGPFLYSLFYMTTGRASVGILSLLALFMVAAAILFAGRRHLHHAEAVEAIQQ